MINIKSILEEKLIPWVPPEIIQWQLDKLDVVQEQKQKQFYQQFLKPGDLVFDVGANIGNRTKTFLDIGCHVVAFEPQHLPYIVLNKLYGTNKNVTILPLGLSDHEGFANFYICNNATTTSTTSKDFMNNGVFPDFTWQEQPVQIPVTTLDKMIKKYGTPAFIKIDVEGGEPDVLHGLSSKAGCLSFEYVPSMFKNTTIHCIEHLKSIGYTEYNYSIGETFLLHQWTSSKNILKNPHIQSGIFGDIYCK